MEKSMQRKIAAVCSAATLVIAGAVAPAVAQEGPTSSITQSGSAPAASPAQGAAPPASSGASPTQGVAPPAPAATANIPDAKLQQFVSSAQQVALLSNEYTEKLQSVQGDGAKQELVQEANAKMAAAVESNGLTVNEFNSIGEAVESDPALAQRAQQMLR